MGISNLQMKEFVLIFYEFQSPLEPVLLSGINRDKDKGKASIVGDRCEGRGVLYVLESEHESHHIHLYSLD